MSYNILLSDNFGKEAKRLTKKYRLKINDEAVLLLSIYNKGEKDTISDEEIQQLLEDYR